MELTTNHQFAHWDSLLIASALNSDCSFLCSEDLQDGQRIENKLQIANPFIHA